MYNSFPFYEMLSIFIREEPAMVKASCPAAGWVDDCVFLSVPTWFKR
jgi:hypothetical protein